ncbi:hypothetical protein GCM10017778_49210 [Streptomyces vinaceus]|nr:hypothetical protein GCM10017778_49210 [Streptomyces vinaceus]
MARAERTRGPRRRPHPIGLGRTYLQSILRDREEARGREQPPVARYARYLLRSPGPTCKVRFADESARRHPSYDPPTPARRRSDGRP